MDERDWLAARFEENRTHLRAVAFRMLGSMSEAEDAVQESWLRLSRSDTSDVENLGGWLTTVVARVSLDMLRSRKSRREDPLDPNLPEPIVQRTASLVRQDVDLALKQNVSGIETFIHVPRRRPGSWPAGPAGGCRA